MALSGSIGMAPYWYQPQSRPKALDVTFGGGRSRIHTRLSISGRGRYGRGKKPGWKGLLVLLALTAAWAKDALPPDLQFWNNGNLLNGLNITTQLPPAPGPSLTLGEQFVALYPNIRVPTGVFPVIGYRGYAATHDAPASWFGDGKHRGQDLLGRTAVSMFNGNQVIYIGPHELDNANHTVGKGSVVITRKALPDGQYLYSLYAHFPPQQYYQTHPNDSRVQRSKQDGIDPTIKVRVGDVLSAGQVIADINTFGYTQPSYAPHLHFETFIGGPWTPSCNSPYPPGARLVDTTAILGLTTNVPDGFKRVGDRHAKNPVDTRPTGSYASGTCRYLPDYEFH